MNDEKLTLMIHLSCIHRIHPLLDRESLSVVRHHNQILGNIVLQKGVALHENTAK